MAMNPHVPAALGMQPSLSPPLLNLTVVVLVPISVVLNNIVK
jgi:hypothetical protein